VTFLEYCNGGSLYDLLHKRKVKLSTQQQIEIALRIAEGMEYLHNHKPKIVHRDLKSENILVSKLLISICLFYSFNQTFRVYSLVVVVLM
jgi:serine/threonine protein kinase